MMIMTNENAIQDEKGVVPRINILPLKTDGRIHLIIKKLLLETNLMG